MNLDHLVRFVSGSQLNGLGRKLEVCTPWELPSSLIVHLAVANMLAGPLISVAPELAQRVAPGGCLLISGFRKREVPAVRHAFEPYFNVSEKPAMALAGWLCFRCGRNVKEVSTLEQSDAAVE